MKNLIDIVNLNADASCLSSKWWLKMLSGGMDSYFLNWLKTYVNKNKKVSLGITGATISDISKFNPEAISYINDNREIFEIILRPYSHDISLLRTPEGFLKNVEFGIKVLKKEFETYTDYFLPPEFMLTNEQIFQLEKLGVEGTFIHPFRFKEEIKSRLPNKPYIIKGLFESSLKCIPFGEGLTHCYLNAIHSFSTKEWNSCILSSQNEFIFTWRDGESSFFLPNGNSREGVWLQGESSEIRRLFLADIKNKIDFKSNSTLQDNQYHYYPVHSFMAWMKEFRMLGYIDKVRKVEDAIQSCSLEQLAIWLQIINSDILSSIEKDSPEIKIKLSGSESTYTDYIIWRSERGFEGEEYLALLNTSQYIKAAPISIVQPHIRKLKSRIEYICNLK